MPDDILIDLGHRLRNARKNREFTQERLSLASGISVRHISKIEQGDMNPSYEVLYQLVTAMGISLAALFASPNDLNQEETDEIVNLYQSCPSAFRPMFIETLQTLINSAKDHFPERAE